MTARATTWEAAAEYVRHGWSVIPVCARLPHGRGCTHGDQTCRSPGKTPLVRWAEFCSRPPTEDQMRAWAGRWPGANIAIITGDVSGGLLVLDADDAQAVEAVQQLAPDAAYIPTVRTPRGGTHFYFRSPPGLRIGNAVRTGGLKLDVRSERGYVVAPPSSGYSWVTPPSDDEGLAELGGELLALLRDAGRSAAPAAPPGGGSGPVRAPKVEQGGRNDWLHRFGIKLLGVGVHPEEVRDVLIAINAHRCQPPLDRREVDGVARQVAGSRAADAARHPSPAGSTTSARPLRVVHYTQLPDLDECRWLVRNLWTEGGIGFILGDPKTNKSTLLLDMALAVASGTQLLGCDVDRPGPVLLLAAEDRPGLVKQRLDRLGRARGLSRDDVQLRVIDERGVKLDSHADRERLRDVVRQHQPRLLGLDPLRRLTGEDENDSRAMADLGSFLLDLARETKCAITIVHHLRKASAERRENLTARIRGSSDLFALGECYLFVQSRGPGERRLTVTLKEQVDPPPILFRIAGSEDDPDNSDLRLTVVERAANAPASSAELPDEMVRVRLLKILTERGPLGALELRDAVGGRAKVVEQVRNQLVQAGVIVRFRVGRRLLHGLPGHDGMPPAGSNLSLVPSPIRDGTGTGKSEVPRPCASGAEAAPPVDSADQGGGGAS